MKKSNRPGAGFFDEFRENLLELFIREITDLPE